MLSRTLLGVLGMLALLTPARDAHAQAETPKKEVTLDLGGGVKLELVLIRPGSFMMGDASGRDDEKPVHKVTITRSFYIGRYEVTQEQWEALMGSNPSTFKAPKNPVGKVSWEECQRFLKKLEEKFGHFGVRFRLPTEAEWEYACRAGSTTKFGYGEDEATLGAYAWYGDQWDNPRMNPVGQKKPNAWGLFDMHGNVFEWCADWYDGTYYKQSPAEDPAGPTAGSPVASRATGSLMGPCRVARGGGMWCSPFLCRSACRYRTEPAIRVEFYGFRVVCVR